MGKRSVEGAMPPRQRWNSGVPAGDHYHPGGNSASRSLDSPVAVTAVDPCGLNAEPWLEAVVRRVLLEVSHELITCHPAAKIARNPVTRKVGQPADGVQVETVVAGPPWLADTLAPL